MQISKSRNGSAIIRELWWSSTVISVRKSASGFVAALRRALIDTSAKWSGVVPYTAMWRRAGRANICAGDMSPNGSA